MAIFDPVPTPYDPLEWEQKPFPEKAQMVCTAIATQGYGAPNAVYILYALKIWLYVGVWSIWCGFSPGLGGLAELGQWWTHPVAFQKLVLWSIFFEVVGLGCGCGPLTGRYNPPVTGFLHFLRPGTTKMPFSDRLPLVGGIRRTPFDALLYAALLVFLVLALIHPAPGRAQLLPVAAIILAFGLIDVTIFLATRAEHYWSMLVCFIVAPDWLPAVMIVQLAIWFWAGVSKLNHFFPSVVTFMLSNSPLTPSARFRKKLYRSYPEDLRPSSLSKWLAHGGAALELAVPTVLLAGVLLGNTTVVLIGLGLMVWLHSFIVFNSPMGAPLEWNVAVVYGGFFLFLGHPEVSPLQVQSPLLIAFLAVMMGLVPLVGNFFPHLVSFLLSMRYYAGNWAYSVWFFRDEAYRKLDTHTVKAAAWIQDQLEENLDHATAVGSLGRGIGFRLMHLQGRAVHDLMPMAMDNVGDYEWVDGEVIAGLVLGWNFGDAHLHQARLLKRVQAQCDYEPGEVRCLFLESQPLLGRTMAYEIHDAATGLMHQGTVDVPSLLERQPWPVWERPAGSDAPTPASA